MNKKPSSLPSKYPPQQKLLPANNVGISHQQNWHNQYPQQEEELEYDDDMYEGEEYNYDGDPQHHQQYYGHEEGDEEYDDGLGEDDIVLIDEDPYYDPTDEEVRQYGEFLGMIYPEDEEFLEIAREGLTALLPEGWRLAQVAGEDTPFFYEEASGQLFQDSPNDTYFQNKFQDAKRQKEIKKQREQAPQQVSKRRSKLHNLIDQFSENASNDTNSNMISDTSEISSNAKSEKQSGGGETEMKKPAKKKQLKAIEKPVIPEIPELPEIGSKENLHSISSPKKASTQSIIEKQETVLSTPSITQKVLTSSHFSQSLLPKMESASPEKTSSDKIESQQIQENGDGDAHPRFTVVESVITREEIPSKDKIPSRQPSMQMKKTSTITEIPVVTKIQDSEIVMVQQSKPLSAEESKSQGNRDQDLISEQSGLEQSSVFAGNQKKGEGGEQIGEQLDSEYQPDSSYQQSQGDNNDVSELTESEQIELQRYIDQARSELEEKASAFDKQLRLKEVYLKEQLQNRKGQIIDEISEAISQRDEWLIQVKKQIVEEVVVDEDRQNEKQLKRLDESMKLDLQEAERVRVENEVSQAEIQMKEKLASKERQFMKTKERLQQDILLQETEHAKRRRHVAENNSYELDRIKENQAIAEKDKLRSIENNFKQQIKSYEEELIAEYHKVSHQLDEEIQIEREQKVRRRLDLNDIYQGKLRLNRKEMVENIVPEKLLDFERQKVYEIDERLARNYEEQRKRLIGSKEIALNRQQVEYLDLNSSKILGYEREMRGSYRITQQENEMVQKKRLNELKQSILDEEVEQLRISNRLATVEQDKNSSAATNQEAKHRSMKQQIEAKQNESKQLEALGKLEEETRQFQEEMLEALEESRLKSFLEISCAKRQAEIEHLQQKQRRVVALKNREIAPESELQKLERMKKELTNGMQARRGYLYQNRLRSKAWNELLKLEEKVLSAIKDEIKYQKIYLKAIHSEFTNKPNVKVSEQQKEWVRDFNSDVSNLRENEAALRKRDACLLEVNKAYNNVMDQGLSEDSLQNAYAMLSEIVRVPLLTFILVPNGSQEYQKSQSQLGYSTGRFAWQEDLQPIEVTENPRFSDLREELSFEVEEQHKQQRREVVQQNQEEQSNVTADSYDEHIETILSRVKYENKINAARYSGYLYSREVANSTNSMFQIRQEVANQRQWCNDVKGYMTSSLLNRSNKFANVSSLFTHI